MHERTPMATVRVAVPINAAGLEMTFETGKLANLADGAVLVQVGDTDAALDGRTSKPREGIDFFPLTVDVEERMYAAGKIPGSFFRREGRPGEQAILTCRLTDRPLRPSFPDGFRNEVQVIATILGADQENPHDIASINGASAALMVSGIPFNGPIGAVRLAHHDGEWIAHPTYEEGDESTFELVVAGRRLDDGDIAIMMVEAGGTEKHAGTSTRQAPRRSPKRSSPRVSRTSKEWIGASIDLQLELVRRGRRAGARPDRADRRTTPSVDYQPDVFEAVERRRPRRRPPRRWPSPTRPSATTRLDEIDADRRSPRSSARDDAPGHVRRPRRRGQEGVPLAAEASRAQRASSTRACASTVAASPTSGRSPPRSASSPPRTAPASSSGARPRCCRSSRSACPAWSRCSTPSRSTTASATCTTTTSRRSPPVRPAASVRRSAARSVTARSPSGRSLPVVPSNGRVAVHAARRLRRARVERLHVDGVGVRLDAVADGRGCADQGAGRRHRDGPRVRTTASTRPSPTSSVPKTRSATWTSRSRARPSSSPRCSSTRRSTGSRPTCSARRSQQAKDARLEDPRGHERRDRRAPRRRARRRHRRSSASRSRSTRSARSSGPRARSSTRSSRRPAPTSRCSDDGMVGTVSIGSKDGEKVEEARRRIELILDPPTAELGADLHGPAS